MVNAFLESRGAEKLDSSTLDDLHQDHDDGEDEEDVDEAAHRV
jgi:hypothetical protein